MMKASKYNIISKIKDSPDYFIMNVLSGSADILTAAEHSLSMEEGNLRVDKDAADYPEFVEKGYVVDEKEEEKQYREEYFKFLEQRENGIISFRDVLFTSRYAVV